VPLITEPCRYQWIATRTRARAIRVFVMVAYRDTWVSSQAPMPVAT
jgi:hypothetical protein